MDFTSERGTGIDAPFSPLYSAVENLAGMLENGQTIILPSDAEQNTDTQRLSVNHNPSVTVIIGTAPHSSPGTTTRSRFPTVENAALTPAPRNTSAPSTNGVSRTRRASSIHRVRTQTLVTRPAERIARNALESLIPPPFRHRFGRGRGGGTADHAIFKGAADYIRHLERRVEELEGTLGRHGHAEDAAEREAHGEEMAIAS